MGRSTEEVSIFEQINTAESTPASFFAAGMTFAKDVQAVKQYAAVM
jgi:hypothetical protein